MLALIAIATLLVGCDNTLYMVDPIHGSTLISNFGTYSECIQVFEQMQRNYPTLTFHCSGGLHK